MPSGTSDHSPGMRRLMSAVANRQARPLQSNTMQPIPPARNDDIDLTWWRGSVPEPVRRGDYRELDNQHYRFVTNQEEPEGEDPQTPVWVVGNCPPWNCPGYRSQPFDERFDTCLREWEVDTPLGGIPVEEDQMLVLKSISYHVISGLAQYDLFEIAMYESGVQRFRIEDMIIDPTTNNPSNRYVFAGDNKPLEVWQRIDRNSRMNFTVKARGLVDFDGNSNHNPGEPLDPNAFIRLQVSGWRTPLRRNVDGGPRPTDLGDMENLEMYDDTRLEGR